ncbi:hypothetical protein BDP27DRAFT_1428507 [Rhodocollybia butyracea]|uniref:Uncharacterized protein n=1 Tax=Rhodocollybia butyracea TaxID=206335 RepID=A0A9P5PBC3_9AGAR|nr:hypothetical protein BDP27DRAFT_1428507 [Rhodocollybia butyracea]
MSKNQDLAQEGIQRSNPSFTTAAWDREFRLQRDSLSPNTSHYTHVKGDSSAVRYFHSDHLGSTIAVSDSGGNIMTQYKYDSFGKVTIEGPDIARYKFLGGEENFITRHGPSAERRKKELIDEIYGVHCCKSIALKGAANECTFLFYVIFKVRIIWWTTRGVFGIAEARDAPPVCRLIARKRSISFSSLIPFIFLVGADFVHRTEFNQFLHSEMAREANAPDIPASDIVATLYVPHGFVVVCADRNHTATNVPSERLDEEDTVVGMTNVRNVDKWTAGKH